MAFLVPFVIAGIALFGGPGQAQQPLPGILQNFGGATSPFNQPAVNSRQDLLDITQQPAVPGTQQQLAPSRLEQVMSSRAGARLTQFGYDQLGSGRAVTIPQAGAVQDDYILGPGDEIVISLRGQENGEFRVSVDRNGQVLIPRLSPVLASGRTFGAFRQDLTDAVRRAYISTSVFASIARVRQISVLVSGAVNVPGQRTLSGLASVVDALLLSGGVLKTGSLRNIRIQRAGSSQLVDMYSVLTNAGGPGGQMRLADGDRILVSPLGRTVAVTGLVRRPGIYELPAGSSSISTRALLALAGGTEVRGRYRMSVLKVSDVGPSQMVTANQSGTIGDSDILFVQLGADQTTERVTLSGGTALAGQYPVTAGGKLSDLLKAPGALPPEPYTLMGIISRKDPRTLMRSLLPFTPVAVINGQEDSILFSDDVVRVLTVNEVRLLRHVVQLYQQRVAAAETAIRNPLQETKTDAVQVEPLPGETIAQTQARQQFQDAQRSGNAQSQSDLTSLQRSIIANLANEQDLVTQQARAFQIQAQRAQSDEQRLQQRPTVDPASDPLSIAGNANTGQQEFQQAGTSPQQSRSQQPQPSQQQQPISQQLPQSSALNFEKADAGQIATNREIINFGDLARQLNVDQLVLVNFLIEHQADISGAVNGPGAYFIGANVSLQELLQGAGGASGWADKSGVELTSTAVDNQTGHAVTSRSQLPLGVGMLSHYIVRSHDEFRFNQVFTDTGLGAVTVQGEVRFGGIYQIKRGEHLSELMVRAGGLTNVAYPAGTVFLRKSAAATEHESYLRAASEVEEQIVVAMTRIGNDKIDPNAFTSLQAFVTELRNQKAVGRIAIAADPSLLAARPDLDPLLEAGDVIYIPQRPSTISVLGQVMQPGSLPYRSGTTLREYIDRAGGYRASADSSNTFIVLPDGSARKVERSWLNFSSETLPPGSAIVVPRDVTPLDMRQVIIDVSQIFSQLAVSIASVAVISR